jgi:hypothetical protein
MSFDMPVESITQAMVHRQASPAADATGADVVFSPPCVEQIEFSNQE